LSFGSNETTVISSCRVAGGDDGLCSLSVKGTATLLLLLDGDTGVPVSLFSVTAVCSMMASTDLVQTNVVKHRQLASNKITSEVLSHREETA